MGRVAYIRNLPVKTNCLMHLGFLCSIGLVTDYSIFRDSTTSAEGKVRSWVENHPYALPIGIGSNQFQVTIAQLQQLVSVQLLLHKAPHTSVCKPWIFVVYILMAQNHLVIHTEFKIKMLSTLLCC
jgi:hypothetical protein